MKGRNGSFGVETTQKIAEQLKDADIEEFANRFGGTVSSCSDSLRSPVRL